MGLSCRKQRSLDRAYAKALSLFIAGSVFSDSSIRFLLAIFDCEIRAHSNLCHSGTALAGSSTSHPQDVQCTLNICAICLVWLILHADLAVLRRRGSPMTRRRWPAAPSPPVPPPPFLLDPLSQEPFRDPVLLVQVRVSTRSLVPTSLGAGPRPRATSQAKPTSGAGRGPQLAAVHRAHTEPLRPFPGRSGHLRRDLLSLAAAGV